MNAGIVAIYLFIYLLIYLFIYLFTYLFLYLIISLFTYLFNYLFIYLIIYSFIHSFIHSASTVVLITSTYNTARPDNNSRPTRILLKLSINETFGRAVLLIVK